MRLHYVEGGSDLDVAERPTKSTWRPEKRYRELMGHYFTCPKISMRDEVLLRFAWWVRGRIVSCIESYICLKYDIPHEFD